MTRQVRRTNLMVSPTVPTEGTPAWRPEEVSQREARRGVQVPEGSEVARNWVTGEIYYVGPKREREYGHGPHTV